MLKGFYTCVEILKWLTAEKAGNCHKVVKLIKLVNTRNIDCENGIIRWMNGIIKPGLQKFGISFKESREITHIKCIVLLYLCMLVILICGRAL